MHYCSYHKTEHEDSAFKSKDGVLDAWCIEGRKEYNRDYSKKAYAAKKAEVAKEKAAKAAATTKVCSACKLEKDLSEFDDRADRPGKKYAKCRPCLLEWKRDKNKKSYDKHQPKRVQEKRDDRVKRPEVIREQKRQSDERRRADPERYKAHQDYISTYMKAYAKTERGIFTRKSAQAVYAKANSDKMNAKSRKRYAWRMGAEGTYTQEQLNARIAYYGGRCYLCGCDWHALPQRDRTIDHIKPLTKGGSNWPSNLRPACRSCNSSKYNKWK